MSFDGETDKTARDCTLLMNKKDADTTIYEQSKDYMNGNRCNFYTNFSKVRHISFGETVVAVMIEEFKQLNKGTTLGNPVVMPVNVNTLTTTK